MSLRFQGLFTVISLVVQMGVNSSCKSLPKDANLKQGANGAPSIVLIGQGGWGSCQGDRTPQGSRIYDSFKNLVKDLRAQGSEVSYLMGCLGIVSPAKPAANMWFEDTNGQVFRARPQVDYPQIVNDFINRKRPDKVYMIGHSYGGWVVLDLLRKGVRANGVFGLDPIDAQVCLMSDNLFDGLGIGSPDCQHPPVLNYDQLLGNAGMLVNLWQPIGVIHSGPISSRAFNSKVVNFEMDVNHTSFHGDPQQKLEYTHRMIGSYPQAWGIICQSIAKANHLNKNECTTIDTDGSGHSTGVVQVDIPDVTGDNGDDNGGVLPPPNPSSKSVSDIFAISCQKSGVNPDRSSFAWQVTMPQMANGTGEVQAVRNGAVLMPVPQTGERVILSLQTGNQVPAQYLSQGRRVKFTLSNINTDTGSATGLFESITYQKTVPDMNCQVTWIGGGGGFRQLSTPSIPSASQQGTPESSAITPVPSTAGAGKPSGVDENANEGDVKVKNPI